MWAAHASLGETVALGSSKTVNPRRPEEFQGFLSRLLPTIKIPRTFASIDSFPMTVTGKIQKFRSGKWRSKPSA